MLEAGIPLLEAARRGFAANGFSGGVLSTKGGTLSPFAYVMPALSKDGGCRRTVPTRRSTATPSGPMASPG
jgi:hypothetical protein